MSNLPAQWSGGRLEGLEAPLLGDWFDQQAHQPAEGLALAFEGDALVWALPEADPPPEPAGLDLGGRPGGGQREAETITGRIARINFAGTGLQLAEHPGTWFDVSKWAEDVDLHALRPGDQVALRVEQAQSGRAYIRSLRRLDQWDQLDRPGNAKA